MLNRVLARPFDWEKVKVYFLVWINRRPLNRFLRQPFDGNPFGLSDFHDSMTNWFDFTLSGNDCFGQFSTDGVLLGGNPSAS